MNVDLKIIGTAETPRVSRCPFTGEEITPAWQDSLVRNASLPLAA
jgi:hypothetical protein